MGFGFLIAAIIVFWLVGAAIPSGRTPPTFTERLLEEPGVSLFAGVFWTSAAVMILGVILFALGFGFDFIAGL